MEIDFVGTYCSYIICIHLECYVLYTGRIEEVIKLIIGQKKIFLLKCCVDFWGYVHYLESYLPSHLTLYHVFPRSGFMSPLEMVIFNSFPQASFSSASLYSLPITFNSSTNWVPAAPPLTAVLVSATTFDLFLTVFFVTSSFVFLALDLLTRSSAWKLIW